MVMCLWFSIGLGYSVDSFSGLLMTCSVIEVWFIDVVIGTVR